MHQIVTIDFHNDKLFVARRDDGDVVALNPICTSLGLRPDKQYARIKNDPILSEGYAVVAFPTPGGVQDMVCLRLTLLNGWLFTIDESRVKDEETRQKVLTYKRECYAVLARAFLGLRAPNETAAPAPLEHRPFPDWSMDEMRTKRGIVEMYRAACGPVASQWAMQQVGFPMPPPELIEHGRQYVMTLVPPSSTESS